MRNAKQFADAEDAANDLMRALYKLRYAFQDSHPDGNKIAKDGGPVWEHIPAAQDLLTKVVAEITKAKLKTQRWHQAVETWPPEPKTQLVSALGICEDCGFEGTLLVKGDHHGGHKRVCIDREACHETSRRLGR